MTFTETKTMYLHADKYNKGKLEWFSCDMSSNGYPFVGKKDVDLSIELPADYDINRIEADILNEQKREAQKLVIEIESKIQALSGLT